MKIDLIWLKNNKKIRVTFLIGLVLAILGLVILAYSIFDYMSNELILANQSSLLEQWGYYLLWWNNIHSTVIIPTSIILFFLGIAIILIPKIKISNLNDYLKTKKCNIGHTNYVLFVIWIFRNQYNVINKNLHYSKINIKK